MNNHASKESLVGVNVVFGISDPWELGEALKWESLSGVILKEKKGDDSEVVSLIIQLQNPFEYNDIMCEILVARPRHEGCDYSALKEGENVFSGLTCIAEDRYKTSKDPFDLSWWRGGVSLIGNISVVREGISK